MSDHTHQRLAEAFLEWHAAMGVDTAVADVPTDWFETARAAQVQAGRSGHAGPASSVARNAPVRGAAGEPGQTGRTLPAREPLPAHRRQPPAAPASGRTGPPSGDLTAPDDALTAARELAQSAGSLPELRAALEGFEGCGLKRTAKNLCFYRGAEQAPVMFIGEGPGREEDLTGKPFVGQAGQLLDKMLQAIDLAEAQVHITNIVYWRPPGNRTPTPQEALVCQPFVERQIELVQPDLLVFLGGAAAKQMLNASEGIMRLRGKWRVFSSAGRDVPVMATLHPAYLLRNPAGKRLVWRDLLAIRARLDGEQK